MDYGSISQAMDGTFPSCSSVIFKDIAFLLIFLCGEYIRRIHDFSVT